MPRPAATTKQKVATKKECGSCGEVFTGAACTNCGEKVNIFPINSDGIPLTDVANAVSGTSAAPPVQLKRSVSFSDMDSELAIDDENELRSELRKASLDRAKARRVEQEAKLLRAEGELDATRKGFLPPPTDDETHSQSPGQQQFQQPSMNSAMFVQALGSWTQEARDQLFERFHSDPDFALNFSRMVNPQPQMPGMPQMGMNPYTMMGGMVPPQPVEQTPQIDPISLVTAMIAGMKSINDLSGGNNSGNDRQITLMLDEIKEMRRETADLREKMIEAQTKPSGLTQDSVRLIIADALSNSNASKANIQAGVQVLDDLQSLTEGMVNLGIMQRVTSGDDRPSLEQQRLDHEIRMDDKKDTRDHEISLEHERSLQAAADTKTTLVSNLFAAVKEQKEAAAVDETEKETTIIDENVVDARRAAVIS